MAARGFSVGWLVAGLVLGLAMFVELVLPALVEQRMNLVLPHEPYAIREDAAALHASLRIADLHGDALLWKRDLATRHRRGHTDLPRLREGNVTLQVFTAVTKSPPGQNYERNEADADRLTMLVVLQRWPFRTWGSLFERARHQAGLLHRVGEEHPDALQVVRNRSQLESVLRRRATGGEVIGGIFGIEGAHALEGELANLGRLHDEGLRVVGLTHFFDNELGGSLHGTSGAGLSDFGREVVRQADRREMVIDVAHASPAMVREVLALSKRPVILSHGGIKSACDTPRNLPDDLMREIARGGGLVGIGFWDGAVCDASPEGIAASLRAAIDLLGADRVALGSDWDGSIEAPFDASELGILTQTLIDQGFTEREIRKVMGENAIAFFLEYLND